MYKKYTYIYMYTYIYISYVNKSRDAYKQYVVKNGQGWLAMVCTS